MILVSRKTMALLVSICMVLHVLAIPVAAADTGNAPLKNSTLGASSREKEEVQSNLPAMLVGEMTFTDYFPDPEFAKAVAAVLSKEPADLVTGADLLQVTSISVYNGHSDIKSLEGISHLSNLRWLTIADAPQLKTLPQEMDSLQHFSSIALINCGFTEFPPVLLAIASLSHIEMPGNALTEIPSGLANGERKILVFNNNHLTRLPDDFWGDSVFAVQAENNHLTERMPERAFYDGEFFLSRQTAVLNEQTVAVGSALPYEALLTPLALQIQELCEGELFGSWNITEPDGSERNIPAVDGSEMSRYRFERPGSYQIEYRLDGYNRADGAWFGTPPHTISELTVSATVVAQEHGAGKTFLDYFPDPEFARLVAGKLNREVTDTVTQEELYHNVVGLNNEQVQVGEIQSIEGIEYLNPETFYLQNTALRELPDTFNWASCFEFTLVNNRYPLDIPASFGTMTNMANLKLDGTQIHAIHPAVNNLHSLAAVSLDGCGLTEIPEFVKNQQSLTELSLNHNYISEIPEGLGTGNLKLARFYNNMIHNVADDFWENDFISADLKENRITARLHEKAFGDGDIGLWNQSDYWGEREANLNGSLPYQSFLPFFVQQIQELHVNAGTLKGSWEITTPDGRVETLPAVDGSEMSAYVFAQTGEYTVEYRVEGSEFYLFELPGFARSTIGELCYTTTVAVDEELGIKTFLDYFPDANLAQAVAEMTGKSSSDATNEVELAGLLRINGNSRGIASLEGIHYLTGVTELSLYNNSIAQLPPEIGQLSNLRYLSIHSNSLTSLPAELGRLSELESLWAGYNSITQLPAEISGMPSLHIVDLSNNQIAQFPNELLGLWQLTELRLDSNQITQLPPEIGQLTNLRILSVGGNGLMSLPAELGQLSNLVELGAGNNQIAQLPPEMGKMTSLGTLDLSYNQISQFPESFLKLERIYQIHLNYNQFVGPSKWEWVVNQDFTNSNQTAELESQQVAQGGQLEYTKLIPPFVQQLQGWNGGVLQGKWMITPPSGEALVLPAATGEEMNSYIFEQQGRYTVVYAVGADDGYWFSDGMFWSNGVSNLTYTTPVLVGEEPEPSETFLDYFPDANLAQAVAEVVGKNNTDETTPEELAGITQLSADSRGITSIKGIEHLTGLTSLKLGSNQIIEVPLETGSLQLLRTLDLRNNQISSLPAEIGSLTNLVNLYVNSNQLTGLPLELNNSTTLRQVYAQNNAITQPVPEIVFTLNSSNTFLQRQTATLPSIVTDWTAIEYRMLLPEFVLQLQAHNNGKLVGTWTVTFPDETRSIVPALDGSEIAADLFKQEGMYTVVYSTGSMGYTAGTLRVTNLEYTIAVEIGSPVIKPIQPGEYIGTGNGIMHTTLGDLPATCSHIAARISETQLQLSFYFDTAFMQTTLNLVSMDSTTGTATYEALINGESWRVIITPDGRLNGTVELVDIPLITHYSISFQLT